MTAALLCTRWLTETLRGPVKSAARAFGVRTKFTLSRSAALKHLGLATFFSHSRAGPYDLARSTSAAADCASFESQASTAADSARSVARGLR